jgi:hypothetical protein
MTRILRRTTRLERTPSLVHPTPSPRALLPPPRRSQDTRYAARGPRTPKPRRGQAPGVQCLGDQRLFPDAAALQPSHHAPNLLGTPSVEHRADIGRGLGVRSPMPTHREKQIMCGPPAPLRPDTLAVQGRGEIGVGRHARRAELVEQEAEMSRRQTCSKIIRSHVVWDYSAVPTGSGANAPFGHIYGDDGAKVPASRTSGCAAHGPAEAG